MKKKASPKQFEEHVRSSLLKKFDSLTEEQEKLIKEVVGVFTQCSPLEMVSSDDMVIRTSAGFTVNNPDTDKQALSECDISVSFEDTDGIKSSVILTHQQALLLTAHLIQMTHNTHSVNRLLVNMGAIDSIQ